MRRLALPLVLLLAAWGPHPEITETGLAALGKDHPLMARLGPEAEKLRDYCWMGDWRRSLEGDFYADDYLLFPAAPRHIEHVCPDVRATYDPYFRRALQALRTETPVNAARWIGSILHFTEDTGSPPHAAEIRGDVHSKMENWIDPQAIRLAGYVPKLLGESDDEAVAGFVKRMEGLIVFSKERGLRLRPLVEAGDRKACEPVVLECALETSRVVADLLHSLGTLAETTRQGGARLRGTISSSAPPGLEKVPAKIILEGTLFSTLADAGGVYEFKNLPSGTYALLVLRAGSETLREEITLEPNDRHVKDLALRASTPAGNLVRNPDFRVRWVNPKAPDGWHVSKEIREGEPIPVPAGRKLRLDVRWKKDARGEVGIRWRNSSAPYGPSTDDPVLKAGEESRVVEIPEKMTHARLLFRGVAPEAACERVSLTVEP